MIAFTFIVRVFQFLLGFVIIVGGIALIWYVILYSMKLMIDSIDDSNKDFFVWLKNKFPFRQIINKRNTRKLLKSIDTNATK